MIKCISCCAQHPISIRLSSSLPRYCDLYKLTIHPIDVKQQPARCVPTYISWVIHGDSCIVLFHLLHGCAADAAWCAIAVGPSSWRRAWRYISTRKGIWLRMSSEQMLWSSYIVTRAVLRRRHNKMLPWAEKFTSAFVSVSSMSFD